MEKQELNRSNYLESQLKEPDRTKLTQTQEHELFTEPRNQKGNAVTE
jgi:hypothetical protein